MQNLADRVENEVLESKYRISNVPLGKPVIQGECSVLELILKTILLLDPKLRGMTHGSATARSETVKDLYDAMAKMGVDSDEARVLFMIL